MTTYYSYGNVTILSTHVHACCLQLNYRLPDKTDAMRILQCEALWPLLADKEIWVPGTQVVVV